MGRRRQLEECTVLSLLCCLIAGAVAAGPVVENGSFEADRYANSPGLAVGNGKRITGWEYAGNAGVNPVWKDPGAQKGPDSQFYDNGTTPDGKQVAFIQGPGKLSQAISGFEAGKRYMVTYRENGRFQHQGTQWPRVRVTLGDEVVVSAHDVAPVGVNNTYDVPFYRVESATFTAPRSGGFSLVFETVQESRTTTLLLDAVGIRELP